MNTHDIELPKPFMTVYDDVDKVEVGCYSEIQVRAAIEADRKRRGEPVLKGWKLVPETPTSKQIVHMACQIKGADADGRFRTDGEDWHQHVAAAERAYKWALSEAPQPADPTVKESLSVAEPVKVPSDADAKHVRDFINCDGMGAVIVEGPQYSAAVRALLARYGNAAQPAQGQEVSIDISTGDHDAGRRAFGELTGEVNAGVWLAEGYVNQPTASSEPFGHVWRASDTTAVIKLVGDPRIIDGMPVYAAPVAAQPSVLDGWKLVPEEPTMEMLYAARKADKEYQARMGLPDTIGVGAYDHYVAMLEAAPVVAQPSAEPTSSD